MRLEQRTCFGGNFRGWIDRNPGERDGLCQSLSGEQFAASNLAHALKARQTADDLNRSGPPHGDAVDCEKGLSTSASASVQRKVESVHLCPRKLSAESPLIPFFTPDLLHHLIRDHSAFRRRQFVARWARHLRRCQDAFGN